MRELDSSVRKIEEKIKAINQVVTIEEYKKLDPKIKERITELGNATLPTLSYYKRDMLMGIESSLRVVLYTEKELAKMKQIPAVSVTLASQQFTLLEKKAESLLTKDSVKKLESLTDEEYEIMKKQWKKEQALSSDIILKTQRAWKKHYIGVKKRQLYALAESKGIKKDTQAEKKKESFQALLEHGGDPKQLYPDFSKLSKGVVSPLTDNVNLARHLTSAELRIVERELNDLRGRKKENPILDKLFYKVINMIPEYSSAEAKQAKDVAESKEREQARLKAVKISSPAPLGGHSSTAAVLSSSGFSTVEPPLTSQRVSETIRPASAVSSAANAPSGRSAPIFWGLEFAGYYLSQRQVYLQQESTDHR